MLLTGTRASVEMFGRVRKGEKRTGGKATQLRWANPFLHAFPPGVLNVNITFTAEATKK